MVTQVELEERLAVNHETRSFEVKATGSITDTRFVAKIARAVLAMGNLRDGGIVCLGVEDQRIGDMMPGLDAGHLSEWSDFDNVTAALARYCDPPVTFGHFIYRLSSNAVVVVLDVSEFDDVPHVCKRDYEKVLQSGHTYVRPRGKPESVPVPSSAEMRELHDLAIAKGVRRFVRIAGAANLPLTTSPSQEDTDRAAYAAERARAWASPTSAAAADHDADGEHFGRARAYTDVAVRPGTYDSDRLRPDQLRYTMTTHTVRLRGWPVPMVDQQDPVRGYGPWIAQDIAARVVPHEEAWRLFTSAQFLHRRVLATDLEDNSPQLRASDPNAAGTVAVWDVLFYSIEVVELGARFATTLGCDTVTFDIALRNIEGRQLVAGDYRRHLSDQHLFAAKTLTAPQLTLDSTELLTDTRGTGVLLAQRIFQQFGATIPDEVLLDYQEQHLR